ncbi:MAG: amino acid-binding protein [Gemmataceae bacterium]
MAYTVKKTDVYCAEMDDQPGALAAKLAPLAEAKVNLEFVFARRQPDKPGKGIVFVAPISTSRSRKVAEAAGLVKAADLVALRVDGADKPGEVARIAKCLGANGINLRGVSAATIGKKFVVFLAFDNETDAGKAARLIRAGAKV